MKQQYLAFINSVANLEQAVQVRSKIAAIAVGYACACNVDMPSAKVHSPELHYKGLAELSVKRWVGEFNEAVVLDCNLALEAARSFWMMRYNAVHNCPVLSDVPGDFFQSMFGSTQHFSPAMIALLNENNVSIARVYRTACNAIELLVNPE